MIVNFEKPTGKRAVRCMLEAALDDVPEFSEPMSVGMDQLLEELDISYEHLDNGSVVRALLTIYVDRVSRTNEHRKAVRELELAAGQRLARRDPLAELIRTWRNEVPESPAVYGEPYQLAAAQLERVLKERDNA